MTWEDNKREVDKYNPEIMEIINECRHKLFDEHCVTKEATTHMDQSEATDFESKCNIDFMGGVGCRILSKNEGVWTVRSSLDSNNETELSKLRRKCAQWYFCGWVQNNEIVSWIFIDLDAVRNKKILDMEWEEIDNHDGTYFIAIPVDTLFGYDCVKFSHNIAEPNIIKLQEELLMKDKLNIYKEWIDKQDGQYLGISRDMIEEWVLDFIEELNNIDFQKSAGGETSETFVSSVKMSVIGKIGENICEESTVFKMMVLGPYPYKMFNGKESVKIVCFASPDENIPEKATLSARDSFVEISDNIEPLGTYQTGVTFNEDERKINPKTYMLKVQLATELSDETKIVDFIQPTYNERLEVLKEIIPHVDLGDIEKNLSRHIKFNNKGKSYPDPLDLKRITAQVYSWGEGIDKNGREWARYDVIDGTFRPTAKTKSFPVWVNPSIFERLNAGKGSYLEIYGILKKNNKGVLDMNACFVNGLTIKSLGRREDGSQTNQSRCVVQPPVESQIRVM